MMGSQEGMVCVRMRVIDAEPFQVIRSLCRLVNFTADYISMS